MQSEIAVTTSLYDVGDVVRRDVALPVAILSYGSRSLSFHSYVLGISAHPPALGPPIPASASAILDMKRMRDLRVSNFFVYRRQRFR